MASSKLTTAIINRTLQVLVLKVGHQNCFAKLATVGVGREHKVEIDVNWTYQEFSLEPVSHPHKKIIVNSDDCCDFERITITESQGELQAAKLPRGQVVSAANSWRSYFAWPRLSWRFWMWTRA